MMKKIPETESDRKERKVLWISKALYNNKGMVKEKTIIAAADELFERMNPPSVPRFKYSDCDEIEEEKESWTDRPEYDENGEPNE